MATPKRSPCGNCHGALTPERPVCVCGQQRFQTPSALIRVLARVLPLLPRRDLEYDPDREAGG